MKLNILHFASLFFGIIVLLVFSWPTLQFLEFPFSGPDREIGAPLDGNWFYTYEHGCFSDGFIIEIRGGTFLTTVIGQKTEQMAIEVVAVPTAQKADFPNGLIQISAEKQNFWFNDEGNKLHIIFSDKHGQPDKNQTELAQEFARKFNLRRCAKPTIWGAIQSLWRPFYRTATAAAN